jgi:ABC-type glycerol-3-phosphate transport system permease component
LVRASRSTWIPHAVLLLGLALVAFPVYVAFVASSLPLRDILDAPMTLVPGSNLLANYRDALSSGTAGTNGQPVAAMMLNSLAMALAIAIGKIAISLPSAYAVVFFRFPLRRLCFWTIFITLMLPVEVRIIPTYKIAADLGLIDTYPGLALPLIASATATLLFRQFFLTIPDEIVEAARIDGAGPLRFLVHMVVPDQHRRAVRDPLHLWLEPVSLAAARHQLAGDDDDCHRNPPDDRQRRRANGLAPGHGDRDPGIAAADRGRAGDAALVCPGAD